MKYPVPEEGGDILIHCGDFSRRGTIKEIQDFSQYIFSLFMVRLVPKVKFQVSYLSYL